MFKVFPIVVANVNLCQGVSLLLATDFYILRSLFGAIIAVRKFLYNIIIRVL